MAICTCDGVDMGSYDATVSMKTTAGKWVGIDVCIATEVGRLWMQGVVTLASCCGHGKLTPSVCVADESIDRMLQLGYRQDQSYGDRKDIFLLEGRPIPVPGGNPHARAWQATVAAGS